MQLKNLMRKTLKKVKILLIRLIKILRKKPCKNVKNWLINKIKMLEEEINVINIIKMEEREAILIIQKTQPIIQ